MISQAHFHLNLGQSCSFNPFRRGLILNINSVLALSTWRIPRRISLFCYRGGGSGDSGDELVMMVVFVFVVMAKIDVVVSVVGFVIAGKGECH